MKDIILKAENISKQYRLGEVGTGTLKHDFNRWWHQIRGKENPYLKIGDTNDRSTKGNSDYVWALQDINFEVERGEVLGIIGKNGAGKSTLLKILSKVTAPTTGSIKSRGRIASLLEVGTGFNGEMTGRENIFLNGAILGMTKKEITSKLDEIIEFSGCGRYIDTPVKRYSSGMTVRLAFAVAAFLEPEILVVDEVLAVGDAEFQKKAIGKMQDISRGEGRTVLFVSHNLAAVKQLCTRGIVLEHGLIKFEGGIDEALDVYNSNLDDLVTEAAWSIDKAPGNLNAKITSVKLMSEDQRFLIENEISVEVEYVNLLENQKINCSISIFDDQNNYVLASPNLERRFLEKGRYKSTCIVPKDFLNKGKYYFTVILVGNNFEIIAQLDKIVSVDLDEEGIHRKDYFGYWGGIVRPYLKWENNKVEL
ncbi:ABC transporter ATP-binding protein [Flavobacterium quisquiliarum]|uniref:Polysaccharide ABC transporter ATP-binding protein n=1 Tax=Flavobacterium quisquiliarum TaxID=1834436 RepID=A0ABV8WAI2_9FLAO|nr:ABC transporter ATP-binding protein [Flavobacterium quisquiliarum]MBW1657709.1 ATP-binding cassette domain-containing protein [Flavobacterium quisquiliarum]NWL04048.1 ABC transporter ATP-binding protein [Flavobacterium collinsii]